MNADLVKMQEQVNAITEQIKRDVSGLDWNGDVKPIYQRALELVDTLRLAELDNPDTCAVRELLVATWQLPELYSAAIVKVPLKLIH